MIQRLIRIGSRLFCAVVVSAGLFAPLPVRSQMGTLGSDGGRQASGAGSACGVLSMNADGTYENGINWYGGGITPPYYGALAECYSGQGAVCSVVLDLTQLGYYDDETLDAYVWDDAGDEPGSVLCVVTGHQPVPPAFWPNISRHVVEMSDCCVDGDFWVGCWPNWPGLDDLPPFYVATDENGPGGCPMINAPPSNDPEGWIEVSTYWPETKALGIGCELAACGPVATQSLSWSKLKAIYQD